MKGIPVFEPTMEEFEAEGGFYGYVKRIEKYGMRAGVVKVVPPKAWSEALPSTVGPLESIRLREPIVQHMVGSQGLYRVTNVAKSRIWNAAQWKEMAEGKWAAPDFLGSKEKGDRSERSTKGVGVRSVSKGKEKAKAKKSPVDAVLEEEKGEEADAEDGGTRRKIPALADQDVEMDDATPTASTSRVPSPAPIASTSTLPSASTSALPAALPAPSPSPSLAPSTTASAAGSPSKSTAARKKRPTNMQRAEPSLEEWQTFIGTFEELPYGMKKEDYTIDLLREVERRYWRTLTFGESPMYGADMKGELPLRSSFLESNHADAAEQDPSSTIRPKPGTSPTSTTSSPNSLRPRARSPESSVRTSTLACGARRSPGTSRTPISTRSTTFTLARPSSGTAFRRR